MKTNTIEQTTIDTIPQFGEILSYEGNVGRRFVIAKLPENYVSISTVHGSTYKVPTPPILIQLDEINLCMYMHSIHEDESVSPFFWPHIFTSGLVCFDHMHKVNMKNIARQGIRSSLAYNVNMFFFTRFAYFDFDPYCIPPGFRPDSDYPWFPDDWRDANDDFETPDEEIFDETGSYQVDSFFDILANSSIDYIMNQLKYVYSYSMHDSIAENRKAWLRARRLAESRDAIH